MVSQDTNLGPAVTGRGIVTNPAEPMHVEARTVVATPTDRVRWGPIVAGLFTAVTTLVFLGVLGLAVGASTYDPGDRLSTLGTGAGWWAAISSLLAFFVGGVVAGRTSAIVGKENGVLQGAMVWIVAIPLVMYLGAVAAGAMARSANAAAQTAAQVGTAASNTQAGQDAANQTQANVGQVQAQAQQAVDQVRSQMTPQNAASAASNTARGAWWTLASMVLGLSAAVVGGLSGARHAHRMRVPAMA